MEGLLLNPKTKQQLQHFIAQPSHTITLIGAAGIGKGTVARRLAAELLDLSLKQLGSYPYLKTYTPENNAISIDNARNIVAFTKLKTTGQRTIRRVIIIEDAQTLTNEAQNALLKTLEEPPVDTVFILTITSTAAILPTILSRTQTISLQPIEQAKFIDFFIKSGHTQQEIVQYFYMTGGLPGLTSVLLTDSGDHHLVRSVQLAKNILQADAFERLTMVDNIVKQKQTEEVITALSTISRTAMYVEASRENSKDTALKRWASVLQAAEQAAENIRKNAQAKLVLTSLFLEI